ncbi:hypothetical protein P154DRAFT_571857 [Amniculicola lignicola CBS 123094]|uniref:DUF7730 domain-containing protein n=1 Tax=Amniculicola lignicola CBS 123094 TaxID=1392246 RepID=A0A6A5WSH9_9PLEO|nr:hypothetical protein P154DRAFT_571857 [Amniculicola lignicola CBS 123094]
MKRLGKKQTVNSQHESLFFKLPGELRNMIYDLVVTDAAIHIFYKKETEKLCAYRCMRPPTWQVYRGHDGCLLSRHFFEGDSSFYRNYDPRVGVLPLLRTCRMIYTELIPIVYSKPTFMFSSFNHFLLFTSSILPSRFSSLQSIHFERHGRNAQPKARPFENAFYEPLLYRPRPEPIPMRNPILPSLSQANGPMTAHLGVSVWWATCKVLQRLPGLKRLRVDIEWPMCLSQPQSQRHGLTSVAERIYRDIVDGFVMLAEGREREEAREIIEVYWDSFPTPADGEEWARLGFMKVC